MSIMSINLGALTPTRSRTQAHTPPPISGDLDELHRAESISLPLTPAAEAVTRPETLASGMWVEAEYEALEDEQAPQWEAEGTLAARSSEKAAAGLSAMQNAAACILHSHESVLEGSAARLASSQRLLSPYRRRTGGKWIHYGIKAALVLGDAVGVTLLGINIGDYPVLAGLMSVSAATAAVSAGLVGAEVRVKYDADRRARDVDELSEELSPYRRLFSGARLGTRQLKLVLGTGGVVAGLIGLAIGAGRGELEGLLVGGLYGGIALAVAGASFVESFMYADEIADHLDGEAKAYDKEVRRHQRLAASRPWRAQLERASEADSIYREHGQRGAAAQDRMRSLRYGILRNNPQVAGHGPAAPASYTGQVGRTERRDGGGDR